MQTLRQRKGGEMGRKEDDMLLLLGPPPEICEKKEIMIGKIRESAMLLFFFAMFIPQNSLRVFLE